MKILCKLAHDWRYWLGGNTDLPVNFLRVCKRCKKHQVRTGKYHIKGHSGWEDN